MAVALAFPPRACRRLADPGRVGGVRGAARRPLPRDALAIGVGILYAFVIEGLLSALATQTSLLDPLVELFVRAGGYSLVVGLGASADDAGDRGPGPSPAPS